MNKTNTPNATEYNIVLRLLPKQEWTESMAGVEAEHIVEMRIETVRDFSTFQYALSVHEEMLATGIPLYFIAGIGVPNMKMPSTGKAGSIHYLYFKEARTRTIAIKRKDKFIHCIVDISEQKGVSSLSLEIIKSDLTFAEFHCQ
jgi:hypothetical protein